MLALCRARGATRAPALRAVGRTAARRAAAPGGGLVADARVFGQAAGAGRLTGDARRVPALVLAAVGLAMCATCAAAYVPAWAEAESARATLFGVERHDHSSKVRLRRANTNLSSLDGVLQGYEYRLRETASFEKIFKYFASVVHKGEEYMTPLDLVRAISPGVPPSPNSKPINIPLFESHESALEFTAQEMPEFFKFGDSGLIPYERFLVIVTLLSLPEAEVPVAYHMCAGTHFKNAKLRSQGLNAANFKFIMSRNIRVGGQGYTGEEDDALMMHLFGEDLKKNLSLEEFQRFHSRLHDEVEKLQYYLLSDRMDAAGEPLM